MFVQPFWKTILYSFFFIFSFFSFLSFFLPIFPFLSVAHPLALSVLHAPQHASILSPSCYCSAFISRTRPRAPPSGSRRPPRALLPAATARPSPARLRVRRRPPPALCSLPAVSLLPLARPSAAARPTSGSRRRSPAARSHVCATLGSKGGRRDGEAGGDTRRYVLWLLLPNRRF